MLLSSSAPSKSPHISPWYALNVIMSSECSWYFCLLITGVDSSVEVLFLLLPAMLVTVVDQLCCFA